MLKKKNIWRFCPSKSCWQRELSPDTSHLLGGVLSGNRGFFVLYLLFYLCYCLNWPCLCGSERLCFAQPRVAELSSEMPHCLVLISSGVSVCTSIACVKGFLFGLRKLEWIRRRKIIYQQSCCFPTNLNSWGKKLFFFLAKLCSCLQR